MGIEEKHNSLKKILSDLQKVVVAYSGGVDSTLLLKVSVDELGAKNVLACIARGLSFPRSEHKRALETAGRIGAKVKVFEPNELGLEAYVANKADRCLHCKSRLFAILTDIAKDVGFKSIICGHNLDDKNSYRPGNRAAEVFGVRAPLLEAGFTKDDVRRLSRELGLVTADIPASPCLATRINYGTEITEQRLRQIERAEEFLRSLGLVEFRVRLHDNLARIEVHREDIARITAEPGRSEIAQKLKSLGFKFVTVDLEGFRSGSFDELLSDDQKQKGN